MKFSRLLLGLSLLIPAMCWAGNFKYDYAEVNYRHVSSQNGDTSKGPMVNISYSVPELGIQLLAAYGTLDTSTAAGNINEHDYNLGIRGENSFGADTDFYTDILYLNNRTKTGTSISTDNGYRLELGIRHRVNNLIELDSNLARDYLSRSLNRAEVGIRFNVSDHFAVGVSYARDNLYDNTTMLHLRGYF